MATSKEEMNQILEKLEPIGDFTVHPMMGEFLLYYNGNIDSAYSFLQNGFSFNVVKALELISLWLQSNYLYCSISNAVSQ